MTSIKSFKEVLEIGIVEDTVRVIEVLDQELPIHTKQNVINRVSDLHSNRINNQLEMEFEEPILKSGEVIPAHPAEYAEAFTITLEEFKDWHDKKNLTENIDFLYGDDARFCAGI